MGDDAYVLNLLVAIRNGEFFIMTDKRLNQIHNAERNTGRNEMMRIMPSEPGPSYIFTSLSRDSKPKIHVR